MPRRALEHMRRMRGGAQAHLLRCEDGAYYVTKFQNNPQHLRILANEMLCGLLAQALGLPVARPEVVEVSAELIEGTPELQVHKAGKWEKCGSGFQFWSRFPPPPPRVSPAIPSWADFEPWLTRLESLPPAALDQAAASVPPEWYNADTEAMDRLLEQLDPRRKRIRELIAAAKNSSRQPFPNWS